MGIMLITCEYSFSTEAKAAKEAGVNVVVVMRPGNAALTDEDKANFPLISSFEQITFPAVQ